MTTFLSHLIAQRDALERQIRDAQDTKKQAAIVTVQQIMTEHGLSIADLVRKTPASAGKKNRSKVPAKYRDSASGQTWSGRGLKPKWLTQALNAGRSQEEFLI